MKKITKCTICGGNNHQCEKGIDYDAAIGAKYIKVNGYSVEMRGAEFFWVPPETQIREYE